MRADAQGDELALHLFARVNVKKFHFQINREREREFEAQTAQTCGKRSRQSARLIA
jgi:hypothetical protein